MMKISNFLIAFWCDGFKFFGLIAPLLSLGLTLSKIYEVEIDWVREISYGWAFFQDCSIIHQYFDSKKLPDGSTFYENQNPIINSAQPTFISLNFDPLELVDSNNVSSFSDNGIGNFAVSFAEKIKKNYFLQVLLDEPCDYEVKSKTEDGFSIIFKEEPTKEVKILGSRLIKSTI